MNDLLYFLDCISKQQQPNVTYSEAYGVLYNTLSSVGADYLAGRICEVIPDHIAKLFSDAFDRNDWDCAQRFSNVWRRFVIYKKQFLNLFDFVERYSDEICFRSFLDKQYIEIFTERFDFDFVVDCFVHEFDTLHNYDVTCEQRVLEIRDLSSLILFVFREKIDDFLKMVTKNVMDFTDMFLAENCFLNPDEICKKLLNVLLLENKHLQSVFQDKFAEEIILQMYNKITNTELEQIQKCFSYIPEACKLKNMSFLSNFYQLISFFQPTSDIIELFSSHIESQIKSGPNDISYCLQSIQWFNDLAHVAFNDNQAIYKKIQNGITNLINNNSMSMLKYLSKYINKTAKNDANIKEIQPILKYLMNKTEFEMLHFRCMIRRIIPLSFEQIEKEYLILQQIKESSLNYDIKMMESFLSDAKNSLNLHVGNVLVTKLKIWPFKLANLEAVYLNTITGEISSKYRSLYPGRILSFPIQFWKITIKSNFNSNVLIANGIQTEILMYLNEHSFINDNSLEPNISSQILSAWIESLSLNKYPILIEKNNSHYINHDFKNTPKIIKLPKKIKNELSTNQETIKLMENDSIDSVIVRVMKLKNVLNISNLINEILEIVSTRFYIQKSNILERLTILENRNYIKIENENVYYIP